MKKILLTLAVLLPLTLTADTPKEQKVVFDCSSDDFDFVSSRFWLIEQSALEYKETKTPYKIVLTIHSGCTDVVSKESAEDDEVLQKIQKRMKELSEKHAVSVEACQIALDSHDITKKDLLPFVSSVRNSITRVIALQNDGYAFIPFN
ncbi:DsrE family protein [bacterium]|nr:DsrE family protein [bacterium]MBU1958721.1 DsrE family protein [bacterium]